MDNLQKLMQNIPDNIGAVLITSPVNRRYYTGFPSSAGTLIALRGESFFIIDSRYFEAAQSTVKNCEVILQDKLYEQISAILTRHNVKTLGVEGDYVSIGMLSTYKEKFPGIEIPMNSDISKAIDRQRMVKSQSEIASMAAAQNISDEAFAYILEIIEPGMSETEIALAMEFYTRQNGSEEASFSFIVAAGKNSSKPHAVPGEYKVSKGDFITMDFGSTVNGYRSDMTRTVAVGIPSERQKLVYDLVLKAQLAALDMIKPGAICKDVDKVARDIIDSSEFKGMFGHGLGHSLGLEVHESPRFNPESDAALVPGMAMSVEPGIYIPSEFGVRIEDVIVVTDNGYDNLAHSGKELIIL